MIGQPDVLEAFSRRVRELRQLRELSQEDLAFRTGLDRTYISGIERGRRNIGLPNVSALARAQEVTMGQIVEGVP